MSDVPSNQNRADDEMRYPHQDDWWWPFFTAVLAGKMSEVERHEIGVHLGEALHSENLPSALEIYRRLYSSSHDRSSD